MMMFKRDVQSLADIVAQCLRHDGLETPLQQRRLIDSWGKVAGRAIEKYTGEKFIRNQTLFVKILNPALRADLSMMRERFVKILNVEAGAQVITDIKFY
jgi:predicted nucleic acid-binding Zn ribbon protein